MLSSIKYKQKSQEIIGSYTILDLDGNDDGEKGYLDIELVSQHVHLQKFCETHLRITVRDLQKLIDFATTPQRRGQKKSQASEWVSFTDFDTILNHLVKNSKPEYDNKVLGLMKQQISNIFEDLQIRVLHLDKLQKFDRKEKLQQNEQCSQQYENNLRNLDKIRTLNDVFQKQNSENRMKKEKETPQFLYILQANIKDELEGKNKQIFKIGMTSISVESRLDSLQGEYYYKIKFTVLFQQCFNSVKQIDKQFIDKLLVTCPQSKVFLIDSKPFKNNLILQEQSFKIKNELFYLTDQIVDSLSNDISQYLVCYLKTHTFVEPFHKKLDSNLKTKTKNSSQTPVKQLEDKKQSLNNECESKTGQDNEKQTKQLKIIDKSLTSSWEDISSHSDSDQETVIHQQNSKPTLNIFKRLIHKNLLIHQKQLQVAE